MQIRISFPTFLPGLSSRNIKTYDTLLVMLSIADVVGGIVRPFKVNCVFSSLENSAFHLHWVGYQNPEPFVWLVLIGQVADKPTLIELPKFLLTHVNNGSCLEN